MAFEGSEFLFFARSADAAVSLSKETVAELSTLGSVASEDSIMMLDGNHRVEILVGLTQLADVSIKDFSKIRTIGLVPQLTRRLGAWRRQTRIRDGLWSVIFETQQAPDETLRHTFESHVLKPWSARRRVHRSLVVPSKANSSDAYGIYRSNPEYREAMWECELVTADHIDFGIDIDPSSSDTQFVYQGSSGPINPRRLAHHLKGDWGRSRVIIVWDDFDRDDVKGNRAEGTGDNEPRRSASSLSTKQELDDRVPEVAVDSGQVEERIENAAEALDSVLLTLTAPSAFVTDRSEATEAKVPHPAPTHDPVRRAIEIREKLQQSVIFVDSATWAKARGIRSNPSAALGKYKQKGRIFSVRSGKRDLYPAFQFAENNAEPLPVIEEILKSVPKDAQGWSLLSWFEAKNVLLNDRKPSEVLAREPDAALRAAVRFYSRDDD